MKKILNNLTPIYVPQAKDNRIVNLEQDLAKVKYVRVVVRDDVRLFYRVYLIFLGLHYVIGQGIRVSGGQYTACKYVTSVGRSSAETETGPTRNPSTRWNIGVDRFEWVLATETTSSGQRRFCPISQRWIVSIAQSKPLIYVKKRKLKTTHSYTKCIVKIYYILRIWKKKQNYLYCNKLL